MKLKSLLASIAVISTIALAGCGSDESSSSEGDGNGAGKQYTVGISQFVEHPSLDEATKGFKKAKGTGNKTIIKGLGLIEVRGQFQKSSIFKSY